MTDVAVDYRITATEIYSRFVKKAEKVICTQEITESYAQYVRAFCLTLSTLCKERKVNYRTFINYLTLATLSEMTEEAYMNAIAITNIELYKSYLYSEHLIVSKLQSYDKANFTTFYYEFIDMLIELSNIFLQIDETNNLYIDDFINEFKIRAHSLVTSQHNTYTESVHKTSQELINNYSAPLSITQNKGSYITAEHDIEYYGRIVFPLVVAIGIIVLTIATKMYLLMFLAIIPIAFFVKGIQLSKTRCPRCRAWKSITVITQELVKKEKVKVRRPLGSAYFRSSGNTTLGLRQTFVSADEKTYNAIYKCRICGYEYKGLYTSIDDKIRG